MGGNATSEKELGAGRGNPIATENQTRYIRPMVDMTLFAALFLTLSGLLVVRLSLRSKLTPLLRRAR